MRGSWCCRRATAAGPWLRGALILHAAIGLVWSTLAGRVGESPVNSRSGVGATPPSEHELELLFEDVTAPPVAAEPPAAEAPSAGRRGRDVVAALRRAEPSDNTSARQGLELDAKGGLEVPGLDHASAAPAPAPSSETLVGAAGAPPNGERPALSLAALGVGGDNPFWSSTPAATPTLASASARLNAALRVERGPASQSGPEAPVVQAARRLTLANESLIDTGAVLQIRVSPTGGVSGVDLLEAKSQPRAWLDMAEALRKALAGSALRSTQANAGWSVTLRLTSSMKLPSGSDPGLRVGVLGQTLHDGAGPTSASISLAPAAPLDNARDTPIDDTGRQLSRPLLFEVGLLTLKGDVGDVAAVARRVVEVAVLGVDGIEAQTAPVPR